MMLTFFISDTLNETESENHSSISKKNETESSNGFKEFKSSRLNDFTNSKRKINEKEFENDLQKKVKFENRMVTDLTLG